MPSRKKCEETKVFIFRAKKRGRNSDLHRRAKSEFRPRVARARQAGGFDARQVARQGGAPEVRCRGQRPFAVLIFLPVQPPPCVGPCGVPPSLPSGHGRPVVMHAEAADHIQVPLQVGRKRFHGDVDAGGAGLGADVSQTRGGRDEDAVAHKTPQRQLGVLPIPVPRLGGVRRHVRPSGRELVLEGLQCGWDARRPVRLAPVGEAVAVRKQVAGALHGGRGEARARRASELVDGLSAAKGELQRPVG